MDKQPVWMKTDPGIAEAARALREDIELRALRRRYRAESAAIVDRFRAGMSRRTLISIYGSDLVDMAIAETLSTTIR